MSTAATTLANRQDPYFTIWSNQNSNKTQKPFIGLAQKKGTDITEKKNPFQHVLQLFNNNKIVDSVMHNVLPAGNLYYKDSLILKFSLTDKYADYFPLLRGFFGFGKWSGLTISSNKENKTFEAVISSGREEKAVEYFNHVFLELVRENNFKLTLKDILYTQREAEILQDEKRQNLYESLH